MQMTVSWIISILKGQLCRRKLLASVLVFFCLSGAGGGGLPLRLFQVP